MDIINRTKRRNNICFVGGKYRYVNHEDGLASTGCGTPERLEALPITFSETAVQSMKRRYFSLFIRPNPVEAALMEVLPSFKEAFIRRSVEGVTPNTEQEKYGSANTKIRRFANEDTERERLNLQYWTETVPMVAAYNAEHNCDVKPWTCVQLDGEALYKGHPYFHQREIERYRIAVAIVWDEETETHKPVYVGDSIWIKGNPRPVDWSVFDYRKGHLNDSSRNWTWEPQNPKPKREFEINGQKFTCPERRSETDRSGFQLHIENKAFTFSSRVERDRVRNAIVGILTEARSK